MGAEAFEARGDALGQRSRVEVDTVARKLAIRQVRSIIGRPEPQKRTMEALGLRRMNRVVIQPDNPAIRGMISKVHHLVQVQEIEDE